MYNIVIKHGFLLINISWVPREALKPEPERRGFQSSRGAPADANASERTCLNVIIAIKQLFHAKIWSNIVQILQKFMNLKWQGKMTF